MVRKTVVLLLACGLALAPVAGRPGAQEQAQLKVVWEREFDKEIKDVVFGETDDGSLYPKVIVFDDEVRYYDAQGNELWALSYVSAFPPDVSRTGSFVGAMTSYSEPETKKEWADVVWELHNDVGHRLAVIEYGLGYCLEGYRMFLLSDADGAFVEGHPSEQKLVFRDPDGTPKREIDLFEDDEWRTIKELECAFSHDSRYVAVVGSNAQPKMPDLIPWDLYLLLFDGAGQELWRKQLKGSLSPSVSVSPHGTFVVGGSSDGKLHELVLYTAGGDLVGKYGGLFHEFSRDEALLVVADWDSVSLVETAGGQVIWTKRFDYQTELSSEEGHEGERIKNLSISDDAFLIAVSSATYQWIAGQQQVTAASVVLLDRTGEEVGAASATGDDMWIRPEVSPGTRELLVFGARRLVEYALSAE